jgi:hypothetical protein
MEPLGLLRIAEVAARSITARWSVCTVSAPISFRARYRSSTFCPAAWRAKTGRPGLTCSFQWGAKTSTTFFELPSRSGTASHWATSSRNIFRS